MSARSRVAAVAAVVVAAALLAACSGGGGATGDAVACPDGRTVAPPQGDRALPAATLSVLGGEEQVTTACWQGQPTVVNFWAEWCEPCKAEMPDVEAVHRALGDEVRFVGVNYEDRTDAAVAFAEEAGVSYQLVEDPDGSFFDALDGRAMPTTLLVDADGQVVYRHAGQLTEQALTDLLVEHLDVEA